MKNIKIVIENNKQKSHISFSYYDKNNKIIYVKWNIENNNFIFLGSIIHNKLSVSEIKKTIKKSYLDLIFSLENKKSINF